MGIHDTPASSTAVLVYNGTAISQKAERLSLTDMWKAAGKPSGRAPSDFLALASTKEFVSAVEASFNAGFPGIETSKGGRGAGKGATFAHWQIALAYAKYLDPQFHMWCNSVVRERMEAQRRPSELTLDQEAKNALGGVFKGVVIKHDRETMMPQLKALLIEALAEVLPSMVEGRLAADDRAIAVGFRPALSILTEKNVPSKNRRALSIRCSHALRRFSTIEQYPLRVSRETGRYLFHVDAVNAWLQRDGNRIIADHVDSQGRQKVLTFPRPKPRGLNT